MCKIINQSITWFETTWFRTLKSLRESILKQVKFMLKHVGMGQVQKEINLTQKITIRMCKTNIWNCCATDLYCGDADFVVYVNHYIPGLCLNQWSGNVTPQILIMQAWVITPSLSKFFPKSKGFSIWIYECIKQLHIHEAQHSDNNHDWKFDQDWLHKFLAATSSHSPKVSSALQGIRHCTDVTDMRVHILKTELAQKCMCCRCYVQRGRSAKVCIFDTVLQGKVIHTPQNRQDLK